MLKKLDIGTSEIDQVEAFNALVDAVNSLRDDCNLLMGYIAPENKCEPAGNRKISKMEKIEKAADPYAEQRKWIGKLCRFWDDNYKITKHFGILTRIDETAIVRYEADNGFWYCACEPVKPDDDIIYKGGDNE